MTNHATNDFTCPKCGGHHFGLIGNVYHCHNADDGGPYDTSIDAFAKRREQGLPHPKPCKWRGEWPPKEEA